MLVAVGGGAIRVGREVARRHIRHLETVAINCDPKVHEFDEFDRRIYLGPESGADVDTGGSPLVGGLLARAAEPSLQKLFRGASFVVLLGSLGGGAGSGAFPYVLEVASQNAGVVSAFVIKPFRCEGERRSLADRALGRLKLVAPFVEKQEQGSGSIRVLDNEQLLPTFGHLAFSRVSDHWASVVADHIERSILAPAESVLASTFLSAPSLTPPTLEVASTGVPEVGLYPAPAAPTPELPSPLPAAPAAQLQAELTFEVVRATDPPTPLGR